MSRPLETVPVRTRDGVQVALHRLATEGGADGPPILLVAGTFSTRSFWIGGRSQGLGPVLARSGFDPWILEPRGHGESERPRDWSLEEWIRFDAPAAIERVLDRTGAERVFWVGHSAGGVVGAAFSGVRHPAAGRLGGLVLLGAPGPGGMGWPRRLGARAAHLFASALPRSRIPGPLIGLGPEAEPARLVRHWMGWNLGGSWRDPEGQDYLAALAGVRVPVLAVAGAGDRVLAPPVAVRDLLDRFGSDDRDLITAGTATGFRADYGHADLVIGRRAQEEVYPRILTWLRERSGREPVQETMT